MSELQQQAVHLISRLSDENISFLIEIMQRWMLQDADDSKEEDAGMQAFKRLDAARSEIKQYLPNNFDPEYELEEAKKSRYEHIN
ncbi:MAG: hypothetical protein K2N87_02165 [Eubacterium sp.]|nr:hypothetical protein [Eubacterium sp.]